MQEENSDTEWTNKTAVWARVILTLNKGKPAEDNITHTNCLLVSLFLHICFLNLQNNIIYTGKYIC